MERQINEIKIETQIQATNPISAKTKKLMTESKVTIIYIKGKLTEF